MRFARFMGLALGCAAAFCFPAAASAQSHPEFIPGCVTMVLYKPSTGPAPHIAFLIAHRTGNNLGNIACRELASHGFAALCFLRQQRNVGSM